MIQLMKLIFNMKTVTQAQNPIQLLYVILSIRLWILPENFSERDVEFGIFDSTETFFPIIHHMNDEKKSFSGWDLLRSDISV